MTGSKYKNLTSREKKKFVKKAVKAANEEQLRVSEQAKKIRKSLVTPK